MTQQQKQIIWQRDEQCDSSTWQRRSALPLRAFHHLFGHALGVALLSLLLHQLLQLRLARGDASLVRRRSGYRLHHRDSGELGGFSGLCGSALGHLWRMKKKLKSLLLKRMQMCKHSIILHVCRRLWDATFLHYRQTHMGVAWKVVNVEDEKDGKRKREKERERRGELEGWREN